MGAYDELSRADREIVDEVAGYMREHECVMPYVTRGSDLENYLASNEDITNNLHEMVHDGKKRCVEI